jgi:glucose/arabinose dehydrogenase
LAIISERDLFKEWLFVCFFNTDVYRYKLGADNKPADADNPEKIVAGLLDRHQHESKSIVLDNDGNVYVNIGAYSNACQEQDRAVGSMGRKPARYWTSAAGIWQFKADKSNQTYGDGVHYATGLRNVVGLDWNSQTNTLFVMQHGRDQLSNNFPALYTDKQMQSYLLNACMNCIRAAIVDGHIFITTSYNIKRS